MPTNDIELIRDGTPRARELLVLTVGVLLLGAPHASNRAAKRGGKIARQMAR